VSRPARTVVLAVVLGALAVLAARDVARLGGALPWRQMYDFADFYCAGEALDQHRNPYLYEPLHACEHRVNATPLFRDHPTLAIPAPQPPYDFPPFMALARLQFSLARALYAGGIVVAVALTIVALTRVGIPIEVAAAALALPAGFVELNAGQIIPFALLFLTLAGAALAAGRDALAGACAALTLIEPHLGLPVAAATFLFAPKSRPVVLLASLVLGLVGLWTVGLTQAVEYAARVLPAQAAAEVVFPYQYSLTYALSFFGVPENAAGAAGVASFAVFFGVGLAVAPRLAQSLQRRELLAYFPAATAVMAGPYQHMVGICCAIPAAVVLATRLRGWQRNLSAAALCALMIPWIAVWGIKKLFALSLFLCALVLARLQIDPRFAVSVLAAITFAIYAFELHPPTLNEAKSIAHRFADDDVVQTQWRAFVESLRNSDLNWLAIKFPTWSAMAALLGVALARLRSHGASAASHER
jgi:hypothetical protein